MDFLEKILVKDNYFICEELNEIYWTTFLKGKFITFTLRLNNFILCINSEGFNPKFKNVSLDEKEIALILNFFKNFKGQVFYEKFHQEKEIEKLNFKEWLNK